MDFVGVGGRDILHGLAYKLITHHDGGGGGREMRGRRDGIM